MVLIAIPLEIWRAFQVILVVKKKEKKKPTWWTEDPNVSSESMFPKKAYRQPHEKKLNTLIIREMQIQLQLDITS